MLCALLFSLSGAFIPLLIYYGIGCIGVSLWRKKSLNYHIPERWHSKVFLGLLIIQILTQWAAVNLIVREPNSSMLGVAITLIIWVPINAFMEQILWIYIFEGFANRFEEEKKNMGFSILGILMSLIFVGMIHALFWNLFLPHFKNTTPYYEIFFIMQFIITPGYIWLYRKTGSMFPIFLIHLIADVTLVISANYSILPYLFKI